MQLKPDCVRQLLLAIEEQLNFNELKTVTDLKLDDSFALDDYLYSTKKLNEAGFINAKKLHGDGEIFDYYIVDMTFEGHEYLETIRSPKAWNFAKEKAADLGSFSLKTLGTIAQGYIETYIKGLF